MRTASVFVDESGSFGKYDQRSPFYLVTLVFHDQTKDITPNLVQLQESMRLRGIPDYTVHAGPLIRREYEFVSLNMLERKQIFNALYNFARMANITYTTLSVDKKQLDSASELGDRLTKQLEAFIASNQEHFLGYDKVIVYYDHGQMEFNSILVAVFRSVLGNVEFRTVAPADYKLFQAADMICSLELAALKAERKMLSKSELAFFLSEKNLYKSYLRAIRRKRI